MSDITARMLELLALLQAGRPYNGDELAARLGIPPRTLRRDIARLRTIGYPVETRTGPGGYYRLVAGSTMPPVAFDDEEAVATVVALTELAAGASGGGAVDSAAARALDKLRQVLPERLQPRVTALRTSRETAVRPAPGIDVGAMTALAEAIGRRAAVTFGYVKASGQAGVRRVEPHRQVHLDFHWYLLGWDLDRSDWRVFRLDRLSRLQVDEQIFEARPLPVGWALDHLRRGANRDRQRVVLVVAAPLITVVEAFRYHDAEFEQIGDGIVTTVLVDAWQQVLPSLAFLDANFTVVEPQAFGAGPRHFREHGE